MPRVRIDVYIELQTSSRNEVHGVAIEKRDVLVVSIKMNPGEGLGRNVCRGGWEAEREGAKADREEFSQGVNQISLKKKNGLMTIKCS